MKYKVWARIWGTASDAGMQFSFYTREEAVSFCEAYRSDPQPEQCFLWDGEQKILFLPIP